MRRHLLLPYKRRHRVPTTQRLRRLLRSDCRSCARSLNIRFCRGAAPSSSAASRARVSYALRVPGEPIRILGWDEENHYWAARRDGEPLFMGVQDLGDAINASSTRGDVDIVISDEVYEQMLQSSDAWLPRPRRVHRPSE